MIRGGFLSAEERMSLLKLVRRPSGRHGPARRAHAIVLLDDGLSFEEGARVMYIDDDTVRDWHGKWQVGGSERLSTFGWKESSCRLSSSQCEELCAALYDRLYANTTEVLRLIKQRFDVDYSRSGMIKLLGRLGYEYRKPKSLPKGASVSAQQEFVRHYEALLNGLDARDAVYFVELTEAFRTCEY